MSVNNIIYHASTKNALGFQNALKQELGSRIGQAIATKSAQMNGNGVAQVNEAEYGIGGDIHQSNHAEMAQMHKEMADKHRRMGGNFNMKAAREHDDAARAQDNAANHVYSFERSSRVHTTTHEPNIKAARAVLDKAEAQSKAAFSASHLAAAEEQD